MITILIGIISAFLTLFINYCIGKPGSEFSPYEIFSSYTVWLSRWRLKRIGIYDQYSEQYHENLKRLESKPGLITMKNEFKKMIYDAAEPFFTWERAAGMCSVCFGVWVSLIGGVVFCIVLPGRINLLIIFVYLLIIVVTAHVTIRLLNKII